MTKSLPSYDEALKRTAFDTNLSRVPSKATLSTDCPVHGNQQPQMNSINSHTKINVASSTPTLSLNGQQQQAQRIVTPTQQNLTKPNLIISNAPKQYFKPHDLNSQAPLARVNSSTPTNINGVDRVYSANKSNRFPHQNGMHMTHQQQPQPQNVKPIAPTPPLTQQQFQQSVTPLELFQQTSISPTTMSTNFNNNNNPSGTSTPRNQGLSRPNSSVSNINPPPPQEFNSNDDINKQQKQIPNWKMTAVPNNNSQNQANGEHTLTKTTTNSNNNEIDKLNTNINNTLNKHINEDILQLQARDAYSITGSSNGSSEYQPPNQQTQTQQQQTVNFKNQVVPSPILKQQPIIVAKAPSPQPQFVIKTQPIIVQQNNVQQQKQQVNGKTIQPTTLNANLAFIEEDDSDNLNKNINENNKDLQSSESYNERDFRRKGIDDDDIDDESSTLSTSSSVQPRIKQQRQIKTHPSTNEKSKILLKNKTLEQDYGRVLNTLANNALNNSNKQTTNNLPGTINNSNSNNNSVKPVNSTAGRPPCRLNFYDKDSDTNTNSEISPMIAHGGLVSNNGPLIGNAIIGISKTYPALMKGYLLNF